MHFQRRIRCAVAAAASIMLAVGSTASASITQIQSGGQGGSEPSVWNVLNALLGPGASLTQADVNGGGVELGGHTGLSRVSDSTDQFYRDGSAPVSVLGLFFDNPDIGEPFGGDAHDLFFENESSGAAAVQVTDGQIVLGQIDVNIGEIYSLTAVRGSLPFDGSQDNTSRQIASSIDSENIASGDTTIDRMVTFSIDIDDIPTLTALDGTTIDLAGMQGPASSGVAYVHFFDTGSDADYQDAVYLTIGATAVPTPGAIALFVAAGGYVTRRRRR